MRTRRVLLSTLALGMVATTATALAAPKVKPACNLVVDRSGDGHHHATGVSSNALDVVGADVATGNKEVVGVIRVKTTKTAGDPVAMLGVKWTLAFQINNLNYTFSLDRKTGPTGTPNDMVSSTIAGETGPAPAVTITDTSVTWKLQRSLYATLKTPKKATITNFTASSALFGGNADSGSSTAKYPDMHPSCVKAL